METAKIVGNKLHVNGYIFYRSRLPVKGRTYWQCTRSKDGQCTSRCVTVFINNEVVFRKQPGEHQHPPDRELAEADVVKHRLKRIAEEHPEQPPAQILRRELPCVEQEVLNHLPQRESLKKMLRRKRRENFPPNPRTLQDLQDIPEKYRKTDSGDNFLLYDSDDDSDYEGQGRILVFSSRRNLELLARSEVWFMDGTFKVTTLQLLSIFT